LKKSAGNPFFAITILRELVEQKTLVWKDGKWIEDWDKINRVKILGNIVDMVLLRIKDIPNDIDKLLRIGAAIGKEFDIEMLYELMDEKEEIIVSWIDEAENRQLIERSFNKKGKLLFIHDRIMEAFYSKMTGEERRKHHLKIGKVIEERNKGREEEFIFDLAHHYIKGANEEKGLIYGFKAADKAKRNHANKEAIKYYNYVKNILIERGEKLEKYSQVLEGLGDVLRLEGIYEEALENYNECYSLVTEKIRRAKLLRKMCDSSFQKGDTEQSVEYLRKGLKLLGKRIPRAKIGVFFALLREVIVQIFHTYFPRIFLRKKFKTTEKKMVIVGFLIRLSYILYFVDQIKTIYITTLYLNITEGIGKCRELAWAYTAHGILLSCLPWLSRAGKYFKKGLKVSIDIGDKLEEGFSYAYYGLYYHAANNAKKAIEHSNKGIEILDNLGEKWELVIAYYFKGYGHYIKGEFKEALRSFKDLLSTAEKTKDPRTTGWGLYLIEMVRIGQGKIDDEVISNLKSSEELLISTKDTLHGSTALKNLGYAYIRRGEYEEAIKCLVKVIKAMVRNQINATWIADTFGLLAEAYIGSLIHEKQLSRKQKKSILKKLKRACFAARIFGRLFKSHLGLSYQVNGTYNWLIGKKKKAIKLWEQGITFLQEHTEDKYRLGYLFLEEASFLIKDNPDDNKANGLLIKAKELFRQCGANLDLEKTNELLGLEVKEIREDTTSQERLSLDRRMTTVLNTGRYL
ncbi:MAG: tetratricopeptide repeat protein, partial [Spirochaetes bacterium]|nr:tetratricopeptide repeat protein [Spirochaetota bacterium]